VIEAMFLAGYDTSTFESSIAGVIDGG